MLSHTFIGLQTPEPITSPQQKPDNKSGGIWVLNAADGSLEKKHTEQEEMDKEEENDVTREEVLATWAEVLVRAAQTASSEAQAVSLFAEARARISELAELQPDSGERRLLEVSSLIAEATSSCVTAEHAADLLARARLLLEEVGGTLHEQRAELEHALLGLCVLPASERLLHGRAAVIALEAALREPHPLPRSLHAKLADVCLGMSFFFNSYFSYK
jgi:hypothetical protein